MKKYNTKPIDFTGCHPVIAEALKRGESILCKVWDFEKCEARAGFVVGFSASNVRPYRCDNPGISIRRHAEPIPRKVRRIMPPERAIPVLIAEGFEFTGTGYLAGYLTGPSCVLVPKMYALMGKDLDGEASEFTWPSCIIEEVEDDE